MNKCLSECVFQWLITEDGQIILYFCDEHIFLVDCDEFLSNNIHEVFAEPVDAFGSDDHILFLDTFHYLFLDSDRVVDDLLPRKLDEVENFIDVE